MLRSPDAAVVPFQDVLRDFNGYQPGLPFIDLRPLMELRVENAYYKPGSSRRGLDGYLGTEIARYEVTAQGLTLLSITPMKDRPAADLPVQALVPDGEARFRLYRFYYEVVFSRGSVAKGSVLLGANSVAELDGLRPEDVCDAGSPHCAVFPEACSVSVEIKISVNGRPLTVVWGSNLDSVVTTAAKQFAMKRLYRGRLTPVRVRVSKVNGLRMPLLPGDEIEWR